MKHIVKIIILLSVLIAVFSNCSNKSYPTNPIKPKGCSPSKKSRDFAVVYDVYQVQRGWRHVARYNIGRWYKDVECKLYNVGDTICLLDDGWIKTYGLNRGGYKS